jgi:glycosyltransferase involved in cell wall biosynthesis/predicted Zn-dependent protease
MASGAIPVIRNWPGADALYPRRFVCLDAAEASQLVIKCNSHEAYLQETAFCREWVKRFDRAHIAEQIQSLFQTPASAALSLPSGCLNAGSFNLKEAAHKAENIPSLERSTKSIDVKGLRERARSLTNARNWTEARRLWTDLNSRLPGDFEACYRIAQAHYELNDFSAAIDFAHKARALNVSHVGNLSVLARALQRTGSTEASIEIWKSVVQREPDSVVGNYRLGEALAAKGHYEEAEALLAHAIQLRPDSAETLTRYADVLIKLGRETDAARMWKELIKAFPQHAPVCRKFATQLRTQRRAEAASILLRDLVSSNPEDLESRYLLAQILIERKSWSETVQVLAPAENLQSKESPAPLLAKIYRDLALAYTAVDDLSKAEHALSLALSHDPLNTGTLSRLAQVLRRLGKPEAALDMLRQSCSANPTDAGVWGELIVQLAWFDRDKEARAALKEAERVVDGGAASLVRLGRSCETARLIPEATDFFERALKIDPVCRKDAGLYYAREGVLNRSIALLRPVREEEPSNAEVFHTLAQLLRVSEMLGMDHRSIQGNNGQVDCFIPELLFEDAIKRLKVEPRTYEPVRGRVIQVTATLGAGGAERQLVTTIRGLLNSGKLESLALFAMSLSSTLKRDFYLPELSALPLEILELKTGHACASLADVKETDAVLVEAFPNTMRDAIACWYREFISRRPEVVHAWQDHTCLTAVVAALLAGVPRIVLSTRSTRPDNPRRRLHRFMERGYRAVVQHPSVVICNNSRAGAEDYERWLGLPAKTIQTVHNGLDFGALQRSFKRREPRENRRRLGIGDDVHVVGGVLRMSEEKRPLLWVETAYQVSRELPNVHFIIAGDGPLREAVRDRAEQLGIAGRFHMPGHVKVASWFPIMDVVLLTSRMEGLPNVLIEAQSFKIPVVAPAVGGVSETILQGVTGWAVEEADAPKLADRVIWILKNPMWSRKASAKAALFAQSNFSIDAMIRQTLELYQI